MIKFLSKNKLKIFSHVDKDKIVFKSKGQRQKNIILPKAFNKSGAACENFAKNFNRTVSEFLPVLR